MDYRIDLKDEIAEFDLNQPILIRIEIESGRSYK